MYKGWMFSYHVDLRESARADQPQEQHYEQGYESDQDRDRAHGVLGLDEAIHCVQHRGLIQQRIGFWTPPASDPGRCGRN
mmetsp:Transcript_25114/g.63135  ORF Transcript_25114/g.63135 Transcript_25114/m.63135 type:complete len:80 (-) Transcript_25114:1003-1242(-)